MEIGAGSGPWQVRWGVSIFIPSVPTATPRTSAYAEAVLFLCLLGLGVVLRLANLADESLWGDEFVTFQHIHSPSLAEYLRQSRVSDPTLNPVYFTVCYLWGQVVHGDVLWVRLLSVAFGSFTILCLYLLARSLYGGTAALFAAALLSLSVHHIYFSQEIRMYALVWLEVALSALAFVRAFGTQRRTLWLSVNIASNALLVWTHWFGAPFIATQAAFLILSSAGRTFRRGTWFVGHAVLAGTVPAYIATVDFDRLPHFTKWISTVTWLEAVWTPFQTIGLNELALGQTELPSTWTGLLMPVLPAVVLAGYALTHLDRLSLKSNVATTVRPASNLLVPSQAFLFTILWVVLPAVILVAASRMGIRCFVPRYIGHSAMALFILLGAGIDAAVRKFRSAGIVPAIAILGLYCIRLYTMERPYRTDFRQIAATLKQRLNPMEDVVMVPAWQDDVLHHYFPSSRSPVHLAEDVIGVKDEAYKATRATGHCCIVVVGGGPKRTERNLSFTLDAIAELHYSVKVERVNAYYHAYVLSVTDESFPAVGESTGPLPPTIPAEH